MAMSLGLNKELEEAVATYIGLFDAVFGNSTIFG